MEYQDKKHWLPTGAVGASWLGNKPVERYDSLACDVKRHGAASISVIASGLRTRAWKVIRFSGRDRGNQPSSNA